MVTALSRWHSTSPKIDHRTKGYKFRRYNMKELDELDKQKVLNQLLTKLQGAEKFVAEEGTISADALEAELEVK